MTAYSRLRQELAAEPRAWLIRAGGIHRPHLLEALLALDQRVTGLDNLSTGSPRNLDEVRKRVSPEQWADSRFAKGQSRT